MNSESRDAVKWLEMQFEFTWNEYGDVRTCSGHGAFIDSPPTPHRHFVANIPDTLGTYRRSMFNTYDDHPSACEFCFNALMDGRGIICLDTTGHTDIITRHDSAVQARINE